MRRQTAARSLVGSEGTRYTSTSQLAGDGAVAGLDAGSRGLAGTPLFLPMAGGPCERHQAGSASFPRDGVLSLSAAHVDRVDTGQLEPDGDALLARLVHPAHVG